MDVDGPSRGNSTVINADGVVEVALFGCQDRPKIEELFAEINKNLQILKKNNQPLLVLVDVSQSDQSTPSARTSAMYGLASTIYNRFAIYGYNNRKKRTLHYIINFMWKDHRVHLFETRDEAIKWLLSDTLGPVAGSY